MHINDLRDALEHQEFTIAELSDDTFQVDTGEALVHIREDDSAAFPDDDSFIVTVVTYDGEELPDEVFRSAQDLYDYLSELA